MPPLFLIGAVALGFGLQALAALISGHADPSYAQPLILRLALALGVSTLALLAARRATSTVMLAVVRRLCRRRGGIDPGPQSLFPVSGLDCGAGVAVWGTMGPGTGVRC